jgi:WhiB family transcriptional regulator, redox-sensing transcriptional regulator
LSLTFNRRQGPPPAKEVPLTEVHALPTLSLRRLRDAVLAGDPGCLCDPELFTGPADIEPEDEPAEDRETRITVAREVCASCPVRLPCLTYALRLRPSTGVWAGFTAEEITGLAAAAKRPARPGQRYSPPLREPGPLAASVPGQGKTVRTSVTATEVA